MTWGTISGDYDSFAWKTLSAHEVDPSVSNGHEFQGVSALRTILGSEPNHDIQTTYYLFNDGEDGSPIVVDAVKTTATWYNARAKSATRSPEWRLYYSSSSSNILHKCNAGDLLVVAFNSAQNRLAIFLLPSGSASEQSIKNIFSFALTSPTICNSTSVANSVSREIGSAESDLIEAINLSVLELHDPEVDLPFSSQQGHSQDQSIESRIVTNMLSRWPSKLGTCREVVNLIKSEFSVTPDQLQSNPDLWFHKLLEAAEWTYRRWEKHVLSTFLGPLRNDQAIDDISLAEQVSSKWMSFRQSRVSRAGQVMEIVLHDIFEAENLNFEWGAKIDGNHRPDFIFPGAESYQDSHFPASSLRMLGAKTSTKERWRQILKEADRISTKHGATRDIDITQSTFQDMAQKNFIVVMPEPVFQLYENRPKNLITLSDFISEVQGLQ